MAQELADALPNYDPPDILKNFTRPLAYASILGLFGAPLSHVPVYREVADASFGFSGHSGGSLADEDRTLADRAYRYEAALVGLRTALESVYAEQRTREPGETVLSSVLQPEDPSEEIDPDELFALLTLLFGAATDNLIYSPAVTTLQLLRNPDQLAMVKSDPKMTAVAYEEGLRWESAVHLNSRFAAADTTLAGQRIRAGDRMLINKGAANRDPTVWTDPHRFDITRNPNEAPGGHVAFGLGRHFCIGAGLARLVVPTAINTLLSRFPDIALPAGWTPSWGMEPMTHRLLGLPVPLSS
jgi:cytochrome P450